MIKDYYCGPELCAKLKEAWAPQGKTGYCWIKSNGEWGFYRNTGFPVFGEEDRVDAYGFAELDRFIPPNINYNGYKYGLRLMVKSGYKKHSSGNRYVANYHTVGGRPALFDQKIEGSAKDIYAHLMLKLVREGLASFVEDIKMDFF